jgi:GT2 family glycosyltransferase
MNPADPGGVTGSGVAELYPSLGVVVVNFNAGDVLVDCVRAVLQSAVLPGVHVVDNASTDDSITRLKAEFSEQTALNLTLNPQNVGFARAVNQVAVSLDTEYLLILNPDCVLGDQALERLLEGIAADAGAGLAGPLVRNAAGEMEAACLRRFPRPWDSFVSASGLWRLGRWFPALSGVGDAARATPSRIVEVEATSGACMLVRRAALTEVGYLDEGFGFHFEDLDLMWRLKEAGWRCLFVPAAAATHVKGRSSRGRPLWVHWQKHRGMVRFYRKCLSSQYAFPVGALVTLGTWLHFLLLLPVAWLRR